MCIGPLYAGAMQRTTVEGVRIAWAPVTNASRRDTVRALLGMLASELAPGADVRIEQRCVHCGGAHGRLRFPGAPLVASVAYAGDRAVVAVARDDEYAAIGIDAELDDAERRAGPHDLAALFAPLDPPDLRGWTAIEAVLKADGRGLLVPPDQVVFASDGVATVPGGRSFRISPVYADPGMIVTLAIESRLPAPPPTPRP